MTDTYREEFVAQYIHTMLWQATGEDGTPLGQDFTVDDFSGKARAEMRADCEDFLTEDTRGTLAELGESHGYDAGAAGHDFALTRNGHGAGFWDRGLGEAGDELTALAKPYGTQDVYVGDSGSLEVA